MVIPLPGAPRAGDGRLRKVRRQRRGAALAPAAEHLLAGLVLGHLGGERWRDGSRFGRLTTPGPITLGPRARPRGGCGGRGGRRSGSGRGGSRAGRGRGLRVLLLRTLLLSHGLFLQSQSKWARLERVRARQVKRADAAPGRSQADRARCSERPSGDRSATAVDHEMVAAASRDGERDALGLPAGLLAGARALPVPGLAARSRRPPVPAVAGQEGGVACGGGAAAFIWSSSRAAS
jgi:hypothetical protein